MKALRSFRPLAFGAWAALPMLGGVMLATLALAAGAARAEGPIQSETPAPVPAQAVPPQAQPAPEPAAAPQAQAAPRPAAAPKAVRTRPPAAGRSELAWSQLGTEQQQALAPLAGSWDSLTLAHRRKWITLSRNYPSLPPEEQARLHARMGEWVALSPQQRAQARLNFAATRKLPAGDKKASWEAYQALSAEEKRKLAARGRAAKPAAPATAAAVRPVPREKLARVPAKGRKNNAGAASAQVDQHTLLPPPATTEPRP